ncbi:hypothetical protein COP2_014792 [Malus domestica]
MKMISYTSEAPYIPSTLAASSDDCHVSDFAVGIKPSLLFVFVVISSSSASVMARLPETQLGPTKAAMAKCRKEVK